MQGGIKVDRLSQSKVDIVVLCFFEFIGSKYTNKASNRPFYQTRIKLCIVLSTCSICNMSFLNPLTKLPPPNKNIPAHISLAMRSGLAAVMDSSLSCLRLFDLPPLDDTDMSESVEPGGET